LLSAHVQPMAQTAEAAEARRQQVLEEVQRRKARQQATQAAADEVRVVVVGMACLWKVCNSINYKPTCLRIVQGSQADA